MCSRMVECVLLLSKCDLWCSWNTNPHAIKVSLCLSRALSLSLSRSLSLSLALSRSLSFALSLSLSRARARALALFLSLSPQVMLDARPGVSFKAEDKIVVGDKAWWCGICSIMQNVFSYIECVLFHQGWGQDCSGQCLCPYNVLSCVECVVVYRMCSLEPSKYGDARQCLCPYCLTHLF